MAKEVGDALFGKRLQTAIDIAGSSRTELAKHLGITHQALSQAINGRTRALTAYNTARAAAFLRVSWYWLATGEGDPRRSGLTNDALRFAELFDALSDDDRRKLVAILHHGFGGPQTKESPLR